MSATSRFKPGEGDWICEEESCKNVNFAKRQKCNKCGSDRGSGQEYKKTGSEIGKAMAEKSRGLFSADDWMCKACGNVNWARRSTCNICNAPKFGNMEPRTGYGGGYMEREVNVQYKDRDDSDDEFDEFGRKKKKFRGNLPQASIIDDRQATKEEVQEEEEEEDDDEDVDMSKYQLESEEEEEDGDLSKYKLSDDSDEDSKDAKSGSNNKSTGDREELSKKPRRSYSSSSSSSTSSSSSSTSSRSRSRSRSHSRKEDRHSRSRSRDRARHKRSRHRHRHDSRSRSRSRSQERRRSWRSRSRS